jgi:hypothetical protein
MARDTGDILEEPWRWCRPGRVPVSDLHEYFTALRLVDLNFLNIENPVGLTSIWRLLCFLSSFAELLVFERDDASAPGQCGRSVRVL